MRRLALFGALLGASVIPASAHEVGSLLAWGHDVFGQVSGTPYSGFRTVKGFPAGSFTQVAAAGAFIVGLRTDGTLVSWGERPNEAQTPLPTGTFRAVSASYDHGLAIRTNGTLAAWGPRWGSSSPPEVADTPSGTFTAVATGAAFSLGLRADGTLALWARDYLRGLKQNVPSGTFKAIAVGFQCAVAIRTNGSLVAWGGTDGPAGSMSQVPAGNFTAVAAGSSHCLALRTDGTLVSWGAWDNAGVLRNTPPGTFRAIAANQNRSMAIRTDGTLVSWGDEQFAGPVPPGAGAFSAISVGYSHALAIVANRPPTLLSSPFVSPSQAFNFGRSLSFLAIAVDPDGDPVTLSLVNPPPGATLNPVNGAFNWTPAANGLYQFQVKATDSHGASTILPFSINVSGFGL